MERGEEEVEVVIMGADDAADEYEYEYDHTLLDAAGAVDATVAVAVAL